MIAFFMNAWLYNFCNPASASIAVPSGQTPDNHVLVFASPGALVRFRTGGCAEANNPDGVSIGSASGRTKNKVSKVLALPAQGLIFRTSYGNSMLC
jgi:hypothetical protein